MKNNISPYENFEFGQIYHLFTRVSGNENIFRNDENYNYFLLQVQKYLFPYLHIYAYCLVPQRFSLLVCFQSSTEVFKNINLPEVEMSDKKIHKFLMQPLSNLLNSYSKAYNKMYKRKGALFVDFIKREKIDDEFLLKETFRKIHHIPFYNNRAENFSDWKYSSYNCYLYENKRTKIDRSLMKRFFNDHEDFILFHQVIQ